MNSLCSIDRAVGLQARCYPVAERVADRNGYLSGFIPYCNQSNLLFKEKVNNIISPCKDNFQSLFEPVALSRCRQKLFYSCGAFLEEKRMNNTTNTQSYPSLVKKIGKTTYIVTAHFSETNKETMNDKIKRMLKNELKAS
jgi:hypothetical protein